VREVAVRNLTKIIELGYWILWPMFLVFLLLTRNRQRIGDVLARSCVIDATSRAEPPEVHLQDLRAGRDGFPPADEDGDGRSD
jgi:uncharacterized RDD family membrane protein YckC